MESVNPTKTYVVKVKFALNLGEGQNKQSFNVNPGDILEFDGLNVVYRGTKGLAASLRTVISFGWIEEVATQASPVPAKGSSSKKAAATVVQTPPPVPSPDVQRQVDPSWAGSRRSVSSDDYGKEVRSVRGGAQTDNPSAVVSSSTEAGRNRMVVSEEEKEIRATRATSGAPTPARAAEMSKTAGAAQQTAAQPERQVQYMQPPSRTRRSVVTHDADEVSLTGTKRATPTQYVNEISSSNQAGENDNEIAPEFASQAKKGRGATARVASSAVESQAPSAVIKTRRAASAPTQNTADMTKVSNSDILAIEKGPLSIQPEEGSSVVSRVRQTAPQSGVTVGTANPDTISVPKATTSAPGSGVIMNKTASVSRSDSPIYDPANYLGLGKTQESFTPIGVGRKIESSEPSVAAKQAAEQPVADNQVPEVLDQEESIVFDDNSAAPEVGMVMNHEGKMVPGRKEPKNFQSVESVEIQEEDYSKLNDEAAPASEPASTTTSVPSNEVVAPDFLSTLVIGGMPWAKLPYQAKIQYINGKKTGNRMVGGCNNLSILKLISEQEGLPASVRQAALSRIASLKS